MLLKRTIQALALAAIVCPGTLIGPAQAQFGLFFQSEDGDRSVKFPRPCLMSDRQLRNEIADQGYEDIFLNAPIERYVQVRATRNEWVYLLQVHICTGDIVDRERLRRAS
jgi:hypothetical protein